MAWVAAARARARADAVRVITPGAHTHETKQTSKPTPPKKTSGYLFLKAVKSANAEAERQDKIDGY